VPEGGATVDIPVGDNWGAGAYVTATLFRPGSAKDTRMPARNDGVKAWDEHTDDERRVFTRLQAAVYGRPSPWSLSRRFEPSHYPT